MSNGAPSSNFGIDDYVTLKLEEKDERTPEYLEELTNRRANIPQKWYPLSLKLAWSTYLLQGSWLKIVVKSGCVTMGIVAVYPDEYNMGPLSLYGMTMLIDDHFDPIWAPTWKTEVHMHTSLIDPIIQVFTDNEDIYIKAINNLRAIENG